MTASPFTSEHISAPRRAKIVCTIGPASNSEEMIRELMQAGMNVARLNFSHGTHEEHAERIKRLRKVAAGQQRTICILQDLQGPKIRTGPLKDHKPITLEAGKLVRITPRNVPGNPEVISTTFTTLAKDVRPGERILLSDGKIELRVVRIIGEDVECEIINGGTLGEHQGINIPGAILSIPALTDKDYKDLKFGLAHDVDVVAVSFVRTAADVREVKRAMLEYGREVPVISKLEKPQAIDNLEEILEITDGVMVARGDLGVELPPEKVPVIQKHVIRRALMWRKPVITATQMLESMIENPRPTRAEASDVANAVFDGSDALMLSGETASGKYPRAAVSMMARIIVETEAHLAENVIPRRRSDTRRVMSISETICEAAAHAAEDLPIKAIAVYTETGTTARMISKYRPKPEVYAFAQIPSVCNTLNLYWGVTPVPCAPLQTGETMVRGADAEVLRRGIAKPGDVIAVVAGTRSTAGSTNFIRLHVVEGAAPAAAPDRRKRARIKPAEVRGKTKGRKG